MLAHLALQEHLLRLAREAGRTASFELPSRPTDPSRSIDVGVRDGRHRVLILEEAWNTFGDIGAAIRSTNRKAVEAADLAAVVDDGGSLRVAVVWVIRGSGCESGAGGEVPERVRDGISGVVPCLGPGADDGCAAAGSAGPGVDGSGEWADHRLASGPAQQRRSAAGTMTACMTRPFDFGRFEALTFDCYGTLIDWETGLSTALRALLDPRGVEPGQDELLERYAGFEAEGERPPYRRYRDVLASAAKATCATYGVEPADDELAVFGGSVVDWPAFPDSTAALDRLKTRFKLGVLTNCDDDLFAASNRRLGVEFDWVVTAQQAGGYKPDPHNFEVLFERLGLPRDRILHVAQSLFHDHVPAKALGLSTVWIDRRSGQPGAGATPPAAATPDLTFSDMASFATAATAGRG